MNLELEVLLKSLKPNLFLKREFNLIKNIFIDLLSELIPISFFENLEENCNFLKKRIENSNGVVGTLINTDFGSICASIACKLNKKIIGVQHGAHYGYVETMSLFNEQEYYICKNFITWGWEKFETGLSQTKPVILPSPRLSEFYINKKLKPSISSKPLKIKKLLYMANYITRFPKPGTCGHTHIDYIEQITKNCLSLVTYLSKNKIHFYYKPYSLDYMNFFKKYHNDLKKRGKNFFHFYKKNQKGLDATITNNFPIIVWDQLGTGALECFVSNVPTIVYWKNIYSKEVKYSKTLVAELRKQNVIINNQYDLLNTLNDFYNHPKNWMSYTPRKIAIENFCNKFALVDSNWEEVWKNFFKKLNS